MHRPGKVYTAAEVRQLDRTAIDTFGIPGITLMRRAGRAAFDTLRRRWPDCRNITVACGSGNNAGDGYIVAGMAVEAGIGTQLLQVGDAARLKGDAAIARDWASDIGVIPGGTVSDEVAGSVVVDALLGTGATGELRPQYRATIDAINTAGKPVLSIDLPSGISADSGATLGAAVRADVTVTFIGEKLGLRTGAGVDHAGDIVFDGLGVPAEIYDAVTGVPEISPPAPLQRPRSGHKNQFGHVLVIGGDRGMGGAVLLAGEAALRTGCGLVSILTRPEHRAPILARMPELMVRGVSERDDITALLDACTVVAVGPGLGREPWGEQLLDQALATGKPTVIDADGLNLLALCDRQAPRNSVLTPHPGEAARLLRGVPVTDRPGAARDLSARSGNVVVLKGAGTLVAEAGELVGICTAGNPGLATAGSGDVLTGIIAGLIAQGYDIPSGACAGAALHAASGDRAASRLKPRPIVASDIIRNLWLR